MNGLANDLDFHIVPGSALLVLLIRFFDVWSEVTYILLENKRYNIGFAPSRMKAYLLGFRPLVCGKRTPHKVGLESATHSERAFIGLLRR